MRDEFKNVKMIVTDMDNTLLRKDKTISAYTKSVLEKCVQMGIPFVFATARAERVTRFVQPAKNGAYVIANNGATTTLDGKQIYNAAIENAQALIFELNQDELILDICLELGDKMYTKKDPELWEYRRTEWNASMYDFAKPLNDEANKVTKILIESKNRKHVENFMARYPNIKMLANTGEDWYMLSRADVSKMAGVKRLASILKIEVGDILAFGDDYNDIEMLQGCGFSVAVENAVSEAKQAAKYICKSNEDDGVAHFIEEKIL